MPYSFLFTWLVTYLVYTLLSIWKEEMTLDLEIQTHHLYVCTKDSKELFKHITFRNFLRNNSALASEYSRVKEQAAVLYPDDIDKYMEFKSEIIEKIYKRCGLLK